MPTGTPDDPNYTEDPYPMKGYIFNPDGTHDGGESLENTDQLYAFIRTSRKAAKLGLEVKITDNLDYCSLHVKDGRLIFPRQNSELVAHYEA